MIMSLPANPVPSDLYNFMRGTGSRVYLPWDIYTGCFANKHGFDTNKFNGYLGTISVPLTGENVTINSFRIKGVVHGRKWGSEGAFISAVLYRQNGGYALMAAPAIVVDRRNVPHSSLGNASIDITQSASVIVSASSDQLSIQLIGQGQGIAKISGFLIDFSY
jgi:hypothetical protein